MEAMYTKCITNTSRIYNGLAENMQGMHKIEIGRIRKA